MFVTEDLGEVSWQDLQWVKDQRRMLPADQDHAEDEGECGSHGDPDQADDGEPVCLD